MPNCDMCGRNSELFLANIEGTELNVCQNCAKYGRIIKKIQQVIKIEKKLKSIEKENKPEIIETIVDDYSQKIRKAREKLGLSYEDFAKKINEKESWLH